MTGRRIIPGLTVAVAVAALAGCAPAYGPGQAAATGAARTHAADGRVTGRFVREGGPLRPGGRQPAVVPLAGTITFRASTGGWRRRVRVGKAGRFSVPLPPGTFTVSARSPAIFEVSNGATVGPGGQVTGGTRSDPPCSAPLTVRVTAGHTTTARVVCPVP